MKVIDLLNKIAKGEEVPKKIKWNDDVWIYSCGPSKSYYTDYEDLFSVIDGSNLNDEIEIIEENEEKIKTPTLDDMKDIGEKVGKAYRELFEGFNKGWNTPIEEEKDIEPCKYKDCGNEKYFEYIADKINELIDIVKELRSKE